MAAALGSYFILPWSRLELAALLCNLLHFSGAPHYLLEPYDRRVVWAISVALQLSRCFKRTPSVTQ